MPRAYLQGACRFLRSVARSRVSEGGDEEDCQQEKADEIFNFKSVRIRALGKSRRRVSSINIRYCRCIRTAYGRLTSTNSYYAANVLSVLETNSKFVHTRLCVQNSNRRVAGKTMAKPPFLSEKMLTPQHPCPRRKPSWVLQYQ